MGKSEFTHTSVFAHSLQRDRKQVLEWPRPKAARSLDTILCGLRGDLMKKLRSVTI